MTTVASNQCEELRLITNTLLCQNMMNILGSAAAFHEFLALLHLYFRFEPYVYSQWIRVNYKQLKLLMICAIEFGAKLSVTEAVMRKYKIVNWLICNCQNHNGGLNKKTGLCHVFIH